MALLTFCQGIAAHLLREGETEPPPEIQIFWHEDQGLFWWDHEQALATEVGVEYLSPPKEDLFLIK
jgi:hypothetical protein